MSQIQIFSFLNFLLPTKIVFPNLVITEILDLLEINENLLKNDFHLWTDEVRISVNRTYGHIVLEIGSASLKIVDVIDWSNDGKINHITTFSG